MAVIGALGNVAFKVSDKTIETLNNMTWSGSARYATHARHGGNALTEFCGLDPDIITFDIELSSFLGVDPMTELVKIWTYERRGISVPLTLGTKAYGKYRWNILSHSTEYKQFDGHGNMLSCTVSIKLQEYLPS